MPMMTADDVKKLFTKKAAPKTDQEVVYASVLIGLAEQIGTIDKQLHEVVKATRLLSKVIAEMAGDDSDGGEDEMVGDEEMAEDEDVVGDGDGGDGSGVGGSVGGGGGGGANFTETQRATAGQGAKPGAAKPAQQRDGTPFPTGVSASGPAGGAAVRNKVTVVAGPSGTAHASVAEDLTPNVPGSGSVNPQPIAKAPVAGPAVAPTPVVTAAPNGAGAKA